jgi:uncharacterized protein YdhG (YjbR/CyaY superfamily)
MTATPQTVDEYLAPLSDDKRAALEKLRRAIRSAAPEAEECICYQIPAYRLGGRLLVAFGAAARHCAFYPGSFPVKTHKDELGAYDAIKGTIRFQAHSPLPATLLRKLVKTRIAERAAKLSAFLLAFLYGTESQWLRGFVLITALTACAFTCALSIREEARS